MDRVSRLCLLFDQDEALLQINTGLKVAAPEPIVEKPILEEVSSEQTATLVEDLDKVSPDKATQQRVTTDPNLKPDQESESTASPSSEQISSAAPDPLENDGSFCPLLGISKYPYRFLKDRLSQSVASRFFDRGQFWSRSWDVYYCHLPSRLGPKFLLLVPASQFRKLIREINRELDCHLSLPSDPKQGMLLPFREKNWYPQPVFLGKCDGVQAKDELQAKVPPPANHGQPEVDEQYLEYETVLEAAWDLTRNKRKSKTKLQQRFQQQQQLVQCYERTQSYLGWHSHESESQPAVLDAASWADKANIPNTPSPADWDMTQPMPYPFWKNPVLISIDVECNERCHSQVTEVGISTLDLSRLSGVPPGEQGAQWTAQIQSRHLRVHEFGHIVNHEFIRGCPAYFKFGTSEWVSLADLAVMVREGFTPALDQGGEPRAVVVVGHNPSMDLASLREMGAPVEVKSNGVVDIVDTAETWRIMRGELSARSLGAILADLGMAGWHLHNAGNDARYTMEVLIRMMLNHFLERRAMSTS
ncbi:uncharacterized protein KD926_007888 [Aspergillus affinis]|uniref:uncharacterized protein n=1 Tax=Aspergillus affinis TaxID=1070780 RepID=UPI0022FDC67C|nr:uncharacterized protein KD926_007888 [Aspergillus affinis]KAI9045473.1 hypothetical protein KD926_007888 [Aspergillus affinis]